MLTRELSPGDRVVELGPGTGTVTREILGRGVAPADLVLIERCDGFADLLDAAFPDVAIVRGDATRPPATPALAAGCFDAIVSGLPLVLFSRVQKARLLVLCFELLGESGALYQFTYGGRCPVDRRALRRQGLQARCIGFVALNMPPAFVYRLTRAGGGVH
jgi:phospholipid N-methyltransferase